MATTPEQRLAEVRDNRNRAKKAFDASPGNTALDDNFNDAEAAYADAIASGLQKSSQDMEDAVDKLKSANQIAKDALQNGQTAAAILGALQKATELAIKVAAIV